ncbi:MAG: MGMT family protein [Pseudomonadota bacterium]
MTTEHAAAIRAVVADIPAGSVATYGQVAALAGLPRRARLVGRVLKELPKGSKVPWHRVITASGALAFAVDSDAAKRQSTRLRAEGVIVRAGKVKLADFRWEPSLDELLWKPPGLGE